MAKGTPIQNHLNGFNSIIIDLESLDVRLEDEDEDKVIILVVALPPSYKHFKEIMLYSNTKLYRLMTIRLTCCEKKILILKCLLTTKLKACE